jgi:hypothetical protein
MAKGPIQKVKLKDLPAAILSKAEILNAAAAAKKAAERPNKKSSKP